MRGNYYCGCGIRRMMKFHRVLASWEYADYLSLSSVIAPLEVVTKDKHNDLKKKHFRKG